jgi:sporulation protein YlmC with PRC-barrel domain
MEKTDRPLTRDALVSMQVIDSKGRLIGKVKDLSFEIGKAGIALSVESDDGMLRTVSWDDVQGAHDFIVLKPQTQAQFQAVQTQQPAQAQTAQTLCPTCGKPLSWIDQYKRWYCYNEKKYV